MKHLKPLIEQLAEIQEPAPNAGQVNWQLEYNKLRGQIVKLKLQLQEAVNPPRTDSELETNMQAVRAFVTSMSLNEAAVTCANLYTRRFFAQEQDSRFVRVLCEYLVEHFSKSSALIDGAYAYWQNLTVR